MWSTPSSDPSVLEPRVAQLESYFTDAAAQSKTLKRGAGIVMATLSSLAKVTAYGRTLSNLLGEIGGFEKIGLANAGWTLGTNCTFNSGIGFVNAGVYGATLTATALGAFYAEYKVAAQMQAGKYYVFLAAVRNVDVASLVSTVWRFKDNVTGGVLDVVKSGTTAAVGTTVTSYVKISPADYNMATALTAANFCHVRLNGNAGAAGQKFHVDSARMYEVDFATYNKVDIDPEYTGEKLAEKLNYVDGTKHTQGVVIKRTGKNLFQPLTSPDWSINANAVVNSATSLTLNATAGNQRTQIDIPVVAGQVYSHSYIGSAGAVSVHWFLDANGTQLTADNYTKTGTAPAGATILRIGLYANSAGMYTFDNLMCIAGTADELAALSYQPYVTDYIYLPTTLQSGIDNTIRDTAYEREGTWYKNKRWQSITLDGSMWNNHTATPIAGSKRAFTTALSEGAATAGMRGLSRLTRFDGVPMKYTDPGSDADAFVLGSDNIVYVSIPNTLTGFSDTHSPLVSDWKAFFNGWKMNNGTLGTAYTGTGTRYWTAQESPKANLAGKISGSLVECPHRARGISTPTTLASQSHVSWQERGQADYDKMNALDGVIHTAANNTATYIAQTMFSFDLVEHVLRKYGASIFGAATTLADRITWLKANIARITCNWYGYGSGPAGYRATLTGWRATGNVWDQFNITNTNSAVAKYTASTASVGTIGGLIDATGCVHYNVYSDPSDGVTNSSVFTEFIELEVELNVTTLPTNGLATIEFKPYVFDYVRSQSVEEAIAGAEGTLSLIAGSNSIEVFEGAIVREKVTPTLNVGLGVYSINEYALNGAQRLKNRAASILGVYKGEDPAVYSIGNGGYGNNLTRVRIQTAAYDPAFDYYVTYLPLDKHLFTANAIEAKVDYNSTARSVQGGLVQQTADNTTQIEILVRSMAEMYKRVKALGG